MSDNDGRRPAGWLSELVFEGMADPVVQVVSEQNGEVVYTVRAKGGTVPAAGSMPRASTR
jgi:hypothetical protein